MTRPFLFFLAFALILGGSIGGAFAGGVALGKTQGDDSTAQVSTGLRQPPSDSLGQGRPNQFQQQPDPSLLSQEGRERLRQRFESGEIISEDLDRIRQQFAGRFGQGFLGGGDLTGTIEAIEGDTVTVNTPQGPLQATVGAATTIQLFADATLADLQTGIRVRVIGQRGEDGVVVARSILINPEDAGGFFGGGIQQRQRSP